jgi:hypothetical protein
MPNPFKLYCITSSKIQKSGAFFMLPILLLFGLFITSPTQIFAQPDKNAPLNPDGGNGNASYNGPNSITPANPVFTPEQIEEMTNAKNIWKTDLAEESLEESNKIMVNYDSLYQVYYNYRKKHVGTPNGAGYTHKVFPAFLLPKINGIDTNIYKYTVAVNKYYARFKMADSMASNTLQANLRIIDEMSYPYKFKATEIINHILPPLPLIQGKKMRATEYETFLNDFFGNNPELIFYCSKKYVSLIEKKQYDKLMKLHQNSLNILDYRDEARVPVKK